MKISIYFLALILLMISEPGRTQDRQYYELRSYHCSTSKQIDRLDEYLSKTFIPTMEQNGMHEIGVFKSLSNDTAAHKSLFVLIPAANIGDLEKISDIMVANASHSKLGEDYLHTSHDNPVYDRIEISWLRAFTDMPMMAKPKFSTAIDKRVFELRSYEGASETLYRRKVDMFNAGGEIALFESLGFNAVFYAEVLAGAHMPNLVYMTSFEDMASRERHWSDFRASPTWLKLKSLDKYKNTVSKADIYLLRPTDYSTIK